MGVGGSVGEGARVLLRRNVGDAGLRGAVSFSRVPCIEWFTDAVRIHILNLNWRNY